MGLNVGIVGAGPAGTAAALALVRAGHRVTIFEKARPPRDKACGDALIPDAVRCLERLGVFASIAPQLFRVPRLRIVSPAGLTVDAEGPIYTCRRARFDTLLLDAACALGAALVVDEAVAVTQDDEAAQVRCRDGSMARFDFVIGATGASAKSLALYGVDYRARPSAYAMRQYLVLARPHGMDCITVFYNRELLPGYGWIFPLGPREVNVGVGALATERKGRVPDLDDLYRRFMAASETCRAVLADATERGPLRGAPLRTGLTGTGYAKGRVLLAGEAIGATYALTGEGIGKAMETAILAADTLDAAWRTGAAADDVAVGYAAGLERQMRAKFASYDRAQRWMSYPWVIDFLARRARKKVGVRNALSQILAETLDPTTILSARGLAALALSGWK